VAVLEHPGERQAHDPTGGGIRDGAAWQVEIDSIGQLRVRAIGLKFVLVHPAAERAFHLFVDEEAVLFVAGVASLPAHPERADTQAELNFAAIVDSAVAAEHFELLSRRHQRFKRLGLLVKREDHFERRLDHRRSLESWHSRRQEL
jgi:hypothetical protein